MLFYTKIGWSPRRPKALFAQNFLSATVLALVSVSLSALASDDLSRAHTLQRNQEIQLDQLRQRSNRSVDVFSKQEPLSDLHASDDTLKEALCFTLNEVQWESERPPVHVLNMAQKVIGQCLGINRLNDLQRGLSIALSDSGLITSRVVVPEQSLATGVLTLRYIPGRIASVKADSAIGWWPMAMSGTEGSDLNQYALDQTLENIRRLKGQADAMIDIVPGEHFATSDVVLLPGSGKWWHGYLGSDNAGTEGMGRARVNAGLTIDSPFFLYDQLIFAWNSNYRFYKSDNYTYAKSLNYNVPFGYWSAFAGLASSRYQQTISGYSEPIFYGGTTKQIEVGFSVVPYRSGAYKGTALFKMLRKHVNSTINDIDIKVQRQDVTGYEINYQHRHYVGRSAWDIGAGVRGSIPGLSHQSGQVYGNPDWNGRSTIWMANAGVYVPFSVSDLSFFYQSNWHIQHAKTAVLPSDYFVIGDRYSVRGFDGRMTLASEDGWTLRNELSLNLRDSGQQLYAGLDVGKVSGASSKYLLGRTLMGAVAGLRGRVPLPYVDMSYDLSLARPVIKPESFVVSSVVVSAALSIEF